MFQNRPIERSQVIHALIETPALNQNYGFDQQQSNQMFLQPVLLNKLEVFSSTQLLNTPIGNYNVIAANAVPSITFTLVTSMGTEQIMLDEPLYSAIRSLNGGFFLEFKEPLLVSIPDSYITIRSLTNVVDNTAVPFAMYFNFVR